ncbi:MAG: ATP-dependent Clp protease adaptor ClpS [Gemmataceae bacterium]
MSDELYEPRVTTRTKPKAENKTRRLPPFHVILLNDDHHTIDFVVDVLQKVLGCNQQKAVLMMSEAHHTGRAIVWTGPKEVAELKQEQIQSFHQVLDDGRKLGPLGVDLEPAPGS